MPSSTAAADTGTQDPRAEVLLEGGTANHGRVVRVGATVRRPAREGSPATRALLDHLERAGFDGAPRWLGVDVRGREVLTYVPGEVVTPPYPAWALTTEALTGVARLLRRFHDAAEGLDAREGPGGLPWPGPVPAPFAGGPVSHNDLNLDNVVFRDGRAVAFIDFDLAAPGSRVWDVAGAARFWAPLRDDADIDDPRRGAVLERLRAFVDAYGLDAAGRERLPDAVLAHHDWLYGLVREEAGRGHDAFGRYWHGGGRARAERTRHWYLGARDLVARAVA